jgi:hypothetical protein
MGTNIKISKQVTFGDFLGHITVITQLYGPTFQGRKFPGYASRHSVKDTHRSRQVRSRSFWSVTKAIAYSDFFTKYFGATTHMVKRATKPPSANKSSI